MKKAKASKKPQKKRSGFETWIVTLLVVLVSLLAFSVGVISGKGLSDKEYALKSLEEQKPYLSAKSEDDQDEQDENYESELTDEEIEQLAAAALAETDGTEIAAMTPESIEKPGEAEKALQNERVPSSVKKVAPSVGYTIQVASFPKQEEAAAKSAELAQKGYAAFPVKVNVKGRTWYRVSIGSFKTKQEAHAYRKQLKKNGIAKDSLVQKLQ